jgi:hypothetical protein
MARPRNPIYVKKKRDCNWITQWKELTGTKPNHPAIKKRVKELQSSISVKNGIE